MAEETAVEKLMKMGGRIYLGSDQLTEEAAQVLISEREAIRGGKCAPCRPDNLPSYFEEAAKNYQEKWEPWFGKFK